MSRNKSSAKKVKRSKITFGTSTTNQSKRCNNLDDTWYLKMFYLSRIFLGMWHFAFANMAFYTRWAVRAIHAKPPPSTYEDALYYFRKAESLQVKSLFSKFLSFKPGFCSANNYYMGRVYENLNQKGKAIEEFKKAFHAKVVNIDDENIKKWVCFLFQFQTYCFSLVTSLKSLV